MPQAKKTPPPPHPLGSIVLKYEPRRVYKTQKKAMLKFCMMNNKKRISILLNILDQISQDNEEARNGIEKSIEIICKEEGISCEQVFLYIFLFCFV